LKVVVTGAAGHLGGNLVRTLLADGHEVRAVVRQDRRALEGLPVEIVTGDVLDPASLQAAFAGAEVVYHLAALISVTGSQGGRVAAVNVGGAANVAAACLAAGVHRLVHVSSIHAYCQEPRDQALDETRAAADTRPALAYDASKAAGERAVLAAVERGLDAVIVNPTAVIGPNDFKPSRMGQVVLDLMHRRMLALVVGAFDWVDARDVCEGAVAAAEHGRTGQRYLLSGHHLDLRELAVLVACAAGVKPPRLVVPQALARPVAPLAEAWSRLVGARPRFTPESLRVLRTCNPRISHDKASAEFGYRPRPLDATVRDTVAWFASRERPC
jgi:dihydroflavonol-4-reductase